MESMNSIPEKIVVSRTPPDLEDICQFKNEQTSAASLVSYYEVDEQRESHPAELLSIPGIVNDVAEYTRKNAQRPNKALAFLGGVSLVSALAGRIYRDESNTRTNTYLIGIAGSATGKNAPRTTNQRIFHKLDLIKNIASAFGTGEGLEDYLVQNPKILFQTDEIDSLIEDLSNKSGIHTSLTGKLLQFFTDSHSIYHTRALAKQPPKPIVNPSLSILGTATPQAFYGSISDRLIRNGLIGRSLVLNAAKREPRQSIADEPIPDSLIRNARLIIERGGTEDKVSVEPEIIYRDPDAQTKLNRLAELEDEMMDKTSGSFEFLWGRSIEYVNKLSMIYAISSNPDHPQVTKQAIEYSWEFVRHSIEHTISALEDANFSGSENDDQRKVYELIRRKPGISRADLLRKSRLKSKTLTETVFELLEMNCIRIESKEGKGRSAEIYYA